MMMGKLAGWLAGRRAGELEMELEMKLRVHFLPSFLPFLPFFSCSPPIWNVYVPARPPEGQLHGRHPGCPQILPHPGIYQEKRRSFFFSNECEHVLGGKSN